jgi:hypothetical protein
MTGKESQTFRAVKFGLEVNVYFSLLFPWSYDPIQISLYKLLKVPRQRNILPFHPSLNPRMSGYNEMSFSRSLIKSCQF